MTFPETARIAAHLEGAERILSGRDVSMLPAAVRSVRSFLVRALGEYRRAGRFPHNHIRAEQTPVFVDEHGTRCAMAHLLELVGAHALVRRVAHTNNLARIHELSDDPELLRWLAAMGLTVAEAARIQPSYCARRLECYCQWTETARGVVEGTPARDTKVGWVLRVEKVWSGAGISVGDSLQLTNVGGEPTGPMLVSVHLDGDSLVGAPLPRAHAGPFECSDVLIGLPTLSKAEMIDAVGGACYSKLLARDPRFGDLICDQLDGGYGVVDAAPPDAAVIDTGAVDAGKASPVDASNAQPFVAEDGSGCGIAGAPAAGIAWLALVAAALALRARARV